MNEVRDAAISVAHMDDRLSFCANRAVVLNRKILAAKGVVNAQQPTIVQDAIDVAEEIVGILRDQLPKGR